jgi:hypothetical protein
MPLRVSATVELVSLAILFGNMATADVHGIAALVGPVHGIAWLFGIVATWRDPNRTTGIAVRAVIPGIGGMLALRALDRADAHSPKPSTSADPADFARHEGIHDDLAR